MLQDLGTGRPGEGVVFEARRSPFTEIFAVSDDNKVPWEQRVQCLCLPGRDSNVSTVITGSEAVPNNPLSHPGRNAADQEEVAQCGSFYPLLASWGRE